MFSKPLEEIMKADDELWSITLKIKIATNVAAATISSRDEISNIHIAGPSISRSRPPSEPQEPSGAIEDDGISLEMSNALIEVKKVPDVQCVRAQEEMMHMPEEFQKRKQDILNLLHTNRQAFVLRAVITYSCLACIGLFTVFAQELSFVPVLEDILILIIDVVICLSMIACSPSVRRRMINSIFKRSIPESDTKKDQS